MTSPTGGRWIFSVDTASGFSGLILGINNGVAPVFPAPVAGKFNIEVFTNPTVAGLPAPPNPDAGFQTSMLDPNGTIDNSGLLTGTNLRLASGDYLAVDSIGGSSAGNGSKLTLGTGKQTVVGAKFDTLVGGQAPGVGQVLSALLGNETVIGGTSNESIWGGQNDSIVAGTGANNQIVVTGTGTTVVAGLSGNAVVSLASNDVVTSLAGSTQKIIIAAGTNNRIDLTGNSATGAAVIGNTGDTITAGSGGSAGTQANNFADTVAGTNISGDAGNMSIKVGSGGLTAVSGSTSTVAGDTITGNGAGALNYNPGSSVAGAGNRIDLTGSTGSATINAFSFQGTTVASPDTILSGTSTDSIFGGNGDAIGVGSVRGAGTHQWTADTVANSSVGFGSFSSVSGSTAQATIGNFNTANDFLFYQGETGLQNSAIVASATAATIGGQPSTVVTLPDGTILTLVGVTNTQLNAALGAGTLFKVQNP